MKGWRGNRQRHSLASKGIKSNSKFVSNGKFNYYKQLEPVVLPYLKHFENDFLVHDKRIFEEYDFNEFIYGIRESGTDIIPFIFDENTTPEQREANVSWVTRDANDRFFYGKDGIITEVSRKEAEKLYLDYVKKSEKQRKFKITEFPIVDKYDIMEKAIEEINKRQYYGMRTEKVSPKKRYTFATWSNAGAEWILYEKVSHNGIVELDANEFVLPYRLEQVNEIREALPPLPLYQYSYEGRKMFSQDKNTQENITTLWALKQVKSMANNKKYDKKVRKMYMDMYNKFIRENPQFEEKEMGDML